MRLKKSSTVGIIMIITGEVVYNVLLNVPRQTIPMYDYLLSAAKNLFGVGVLILFYVHVLPWLWDVNKMILRRLGFRR